MGLGIPAEEFCFPWYNVIMMTPTSGTGFGTPLEPSCAPLGHIPQGQRPFWCDLGVHKKSLGMSQTPYPSVGVIIISLFAVPCTSCLTKKQSNSLFGRYVWLVPTPPPPRGSCIIYRWAFREWFSCFHSLCSVCLSGGSRMSSRRRLCPQGIPPSLASDFSLESTPRRASRKIGGFVRLEMNLIPCFTVVLFGNPIMRAQVALVTDGMQWRRLWRSLEEVRTISSAWREATVTPVQI